MTRTSFEVLWAAPAVRDLESIVDYVAEQAPLAAERLFEKIAKTAITLDTSPMRGRLVPELARFEIFTFRELLVTPYRLMYRIDGPRVLVVAVFDGRRDLMDVLFSRLIHP